MAWEGASFTWQADIEAELTKALASKSEKKKHQVSGYNSVLVVWDQTEFGSRLGLTGDSYEDGKIRKAAWPSPDSRPNLVEVWLVNTLWEHMTRKAQVHILTRGETPSQWSAAELAREEAWLRGCTDCVLRRPVPMDICVAFRLACVGGLSVASTAPLLRTTPKRRERKVRE